MLSCSGRCPEPLKSAREAPEIEFGGLTTSGSGDLKLTYSPVASQYGPTRYGRIGKVWSDGRIRIGFEIWMANCVGPVLNLTPPGPVTREL